jgi:hypothetical protein
MRGLRVRMGINTGGPVCAAVLKGWQLRTGRHTDPLMPECCPPYKPPGIPEAVFVHDLTHAVEYSGVRRRAWGARAQGWATRPGAVACARASVSTSEGKAGRG